MRHHSRTPFPFQKVWILAAFALLGAGVVQAQPDVSVPKLAGTLASRAAQDYRLRAAYPESSRVLARGEVDPILSQREPAPHSLPARMNDGRGADQAAADGIFTGIFRMPAGRVPELAESFLVKIEAVGEQSSARIAGGFLYSNPWAHLTGRFRDRVEDGNLIVSAEVEVTRAGRFHLAGTLYTGGNETLGWAQAAVELPVGTHWLDLSYYGRMFHDRGAAGAYHLGTLSLATTSGMPNALNHLAEGVHTTQTYRLEAFTTEAFSDSGLLDAAQRLETEAALSRLKAGSK